jgi:hypothetical protein
LRHVAVSVNDRVAFAKWTGRHEDLFVVNDGAVTNVYFDRGGGGVSRVTARGGDEPSWSPDGKQLAFSRAGDLYILKVGHHGALPERITTNASWPAWSPDGRYLAFIRARGRRAGAVFTIRTTGRHLRRVGRTRARSIDWQPRAAPPARSCTMPPAAQIMLDSPETILAVQTGSEYLGQYREPTQTVLGCLKSSGVVRKVITIAPNDGNGGNEQLGTGSFGGDVHPNWYEMNGTELAVLVGRQNRYNDGSDAITVFDLLTGLTRSVGIGGVGYDTPTYALDPQGRLAWIMPPPPDAPPTAPRISQLGVSDRQGTRALDSGDLSDLNIVGNTVTWNNAGQPHTAPLSY